MKTSFIPFAVIIILSAGFVPVRDACSSNARQSIAGVDEVMRSPGRYKGVIKIEGAVSEVYPKDNFIVLIDRKEFKQCGKTTCALLKLPVKWSGPIPSVSDIVAVTGEVKENKGARFFDASALEKIPHEQQRVDR